MNRDEKAQAISELEGAIGSATNAFLIDFKGITVPQVTELRKQVRDTNSSYVVVKNTLALIAVKNSPLKALEGAFTGPTAVAYNATDAVALAKEKELTTIGLLGFDGGVLRPLVDECVWIPTEDGLYGPVESVHLMVCHLVTASLAIPSRASVATQS